MLKLPKNKAQPDRRPSYSLRCQEAFIIFGGFPRFQRFPKRLGTLVDPSWVFLQKQTSKNRLPAPDWARCSASTAPFEAPFTGCSPVLIPGQVAALISFGVKKKWIFRDVLGSKYRQRLGGMFQVLQF